MPVSSSVALWRRGALALLGALAMVAHAQAFQISEADMVRQLQAKPASKQGAPDPDAEFARDDASSKGLPRAPDTNGACLPNDGGASSTKTLGVVAVAPVPIAPAGAPQLTLHLQFEFASYRLTGADQRLLDVLARAVNGADLRDGRFTVAGHTDATGDPHTNLKLSCARALSARSYLMAHGVDPARISAYGFGSDKPASAQASDAENRRVEIRRAEF
ncbi:MAG: OmpA family protein [Pseudomonadota bacterium]